MTDSSVCPKCGDTIPERGPTWPFCSKRCSDADLMGWFSGEYCLSRDITEEDFADPAVAQAFAEKLGTLDPYDPRFS